MEKQIVINENGDTIPIKVEEVDGVHIISVDGVVWVKTENYLHATILFNMMYEHLTKYMSYAKQ